MGENTRYVDAALGFCWNSRIFLPSITTTPLSEGLEEVVRRTVTIPLLFACSSHNAWRLIASKRISPYTTRNWDGTFPCRRRRESAVPDAAFSSTYFISTPNSEQSFTSSKMPVNTCFLAMIEMLRNPDKRSFRSRSEERRGRER